MARFCLNFTCAQRQNDDRSTVCQACQQPLLICDRYFLSEQLSSPQGNSEVWAVEDWGYWHNPNLDLDDEDEFESTNKIIKIIKFNDYDSLSLLRQEYQILLELKKRNPQLPIPQVADDSTKSLFADGDHHCLVMSRLPGISLATWLAQQEQLLSATQTYQRLQQLVDIIAQFHQAGICHLDLHPGNILITDSEQLSIIDFGKAAHYPGHTAHPGLAGYTAPELHNGRFGPASDYFALGRLFVQLCSGRHPNQIFAESPKTNWGQYASQLTPQCVALLNDLMAVSVRKRQWHINNLNQRLYTLRFPLQARRRQLFLAAGLGFCATSLTLGIRWTGLLMGWELAAFDQGLKLRPHEPIDSRIVIVAVSASEEPQLNRSITDANLSQLLQKLNAYQATTIGLDLYRDYPVEKSSEASQRQNSVQQPFGYRPEILVQLLQQDNLFSVCNLPDPTRQEKGISPPPEIRAKNPQNIGFADALDDGNDMIRRHFLIDEKKSPTDVCPAYLDLAFLLALHYLDKMHGIRISEPSSDQLKLGSASLTALTSGHAKYLYLDRAAGAYQGADLRGHQILLNYRSRPTPQEAVPIVSFASLLSDQVQPSLLKKRIVLIGAITSPSELEDKWDTPTAIEVPGVVIQAHKVSQIISRVLDERPLLWVLPLWAEGLWIWGWSFSLGMGCLLLWRFPGRAIIFSLFMLAGITFCCYMLLLTASWLPLIPTSLSMVLVEGMLQLRTQISFPRYFNRFLLRRSLSCE